MSYHEKICLCFGGDFIRIGVSVFVYIQKVQDDAALLFVQSHGSQEIEHLPEGHVETLEKALRIVARQRRVGDLIEPLK